jgi:hypothetical protein
MEVPCALRIARRTAASIKRQIPKSLLTCRKDVKPPSRCRSHGSRGASHPSGTHPPSGDVWWRPGRGSVGLRLPTGSLMQARPLRSESVTGHERLKQLRFSPDSPQGHLARGRGRLRACSGPRRPRAAASPSTSSSARQAALSCCFSHCSRLGPPFRRLRRRRRIQGSSPRRRAMPLYVYSPWYSRCRSISSMSARVAAGWGRRGCEAAAGEEQQFGQAVDLDAFGSACYEFGFVACDKAERGAGPRGRGELRQVSPFGFRNRGYDSHSWSDHDLGRVAGCRNVPGSARQGR